MSHKDSKPSLYHTQRQDTIYLDRAKPNLPPLENDSSDFLSKESSTQTENNVLEAILPKEPDTDDTEFISALKSEKGRELIRSMCKNESLKKVLIDFSNDTIHPELRKVLRDSIFSHQTIKFDSMLPQTTRGSNSYDFTSITAFLETTPDEADFVSNFFVKIHSDTLVNYLLDEYLRTSSTTLNSFIVDTLSSKNPEEIVPLILERQSLTNSKQSVLNDVLERISQEPSVDRVLPVSHEQHDPNDLPVDLEEPRRYRHSRREPRLKSNENQGEGGTNPEIEEGIDGVENPNEKVDIELSFGEKVVINVERAIDAITNIFDSKWVNRIFRIDWIKESFEHAIDYLERSKPIDYIRFKYEQLVHDLSSKHSVRITLSDDQPFSCPSLVFFLEANRDPIVWHGLEEFFIACPTQENARGILTELLNTSNSEIKDKLIHLLIRMDPAVTVPVITENEFELAQNHISCYELLLEIQRTHQESVPNRESSIEDVAIIRRRETPEVPSQKSVPESNEPPGDFLSLLDNDAAIKIVTSIYQSSQKNLDAHLSTLLKALKFRIENGNLSESVINNVTHFLKVIGPKAIPKLLEVQGSERFETFRNMLLVKL